MWFKRKQNLNKIIRLLAVEVFLITTAFLLVSCSRQEAADSSGGRVGQSVSKKGQISYYTCGMHPSVRVTPEEYDSGNVNCPICNMKLTPVFKEGSGITTEGYYGCGMEGEEHVFLIEEIEGMTKCPVCGMPLKELSKEEADKLKGVVSRVKVKGEQARRAGVKSEPVEKQHLFKEIRTVGRVAYDPGLAVAQEEFISSVRALDKMQDGRIAEIKERAQRLVESSRRKLKLLGLNEEQIKELEDEKQIHTSLIMPEDKAWIYGDVYEFELNWVKPGEKVEITAAGLEGEKLSGVISSVNPVLDPQTRSVRFRAEVDNPGLILKPEMYVDVVIQSMYTSPNGEDKVLAIPREAVLDTGRRKLVWVDNGGGEYEGRIVETGPEAVASIDGMDVRFYPVLKGLKEGDLVVVKANFLIDSQSQISGVAASAYGGALESEGEAAAPVHQH